MVYMDNFKSQHMYMIHAPVWDNCMLFQKEPVSFVYLIKTVSVLIRFSSFLHDFWPGHADF